MTINEFKKVGRLLKEVYKELEAEALKDGIDIFGAEYKQIQDKVRLAVLTRMGFTLDEYRIAKELVAPAKKVTTNEKLERTKEDIEEVAESVAELDIPDEEEILKKAKDIAENVVKPPVIKKEIVEKTTIEKPTIVKETVEKTINKEYEDGPLWAELGYLEERLDNLPEPEEPDYEALKEELRNDFAVFFEHNIDTMGMPDFRKLAMGLQAEVDKKINGFGITNFYVSDTAPANPSTNDLWLDTGGYSYTAVTTTYTVQTLDYLVDCDGTFTVTLPTAVDFAGEYIIKNSGSGIITLATDGSETIDGNSTAEIPINDSLQLRSDDAGWLII